MTNPAVPVGMVTTASARLRELRQDPAGSPSKTSRVLLPRLALTTVVALGTLASPSGAAPTADQLSTGSAAFSLYSAKDRASFLVEVVARVSQAGVSTDKGTVSVTIRRCGGVTCGKPVRYVAAITGAHFAVEPDLSTGFLNVPLFGRPLALTWSGAEGQRLPGYDLGGQGTLRVGGRLYQAKDVAGLVAGRPCRSKRGMVSHEVVVDTAPPVGARALPSRPPKALAGLLSGVCSSIPVD